MKTMNGKQVDLDKLVIGKLPDGVLEAISQMEITVADVQAWDESQPDFYVRRNGSYLDLQLRMRIQTKKYVVAIGTAISAIAIAVKLLHDYGPMVYDLLKQFDF